MHVLRYAARYARGTVLLAVVIGTAGGSLAAWTVKLVADTLQTGHTTRERFVAFVALALGSTLTGFLSTDLLSRFSQRHMLTMHRDLIRRVVGSGLRNVEQLGSGRLMATLTEDVGIITSMIASVPMAIANLAIVLGCFVYVAWLSLTVWAIGTLCVGLGIVSYLFVARHAKTIMLDARNEWDGLLGNYRALTDGFTELKLHRPRRTAFVSATLHASLERIARLSVSGLRLHNTAAHYNQLMFFLVVGAILFGAGRLRASDTAAVTSALLALLYGRGPLEALVGWFPTITRAELALRKYEEVIAALPPEQETAAGPAAIGRSAQVDLVGVRYQYSSEAGDRFDLGPIDLTLRAGEILFVTGGNGSGKSTLAKIIAGLYPPAAGEVRVDGVPVTSANRDQYRQLVSSIFTSFHLFSELLGLERPTLDREADAWLVRVRLNDRVRVRDGRFSDLNLSTGQRKRLALVVAMLEDRPICIFDEWAADQDSQYREEFYSRVLPDLKARHKTVIVISHDDRYYGLGDRVIKLDRGRIVSDEPVPEHVGAARLVAVPGWPGGV